MVATKFTASRARGKCCRMCVKKFHIRDLAQAAQEDYTQLQPVVDTKLKQFKEKERDRVTQNPES